jgi:DNA ligase-1
MKTLYKKDTKGNIRKLELSVEGDVFVQVSGLIDGKTVRHEKICKPKNVGKSNARTAVEQAEAEMQAKYDIKLSEGYFSDKQSAEKEEVLMPMLAKVYEDHASKIDWENAFIQPKLDGMRCLAIIKDHKVTLLSRKNKEIITMGHIAAELEVLPDMVIDGELYAHGKTFQENMKLIKKYRSGESEAVKFHVYDLIEEKPFIDRYTRLSTIHISIDFKNIELVPTMRLVAESGIGIIHTDYIAKGYEGSMIRHGDAAYKVNGRSDSLLKYKEFQDITATIIDVEEAEGIKGHGVPVLKYSNKKMSGTNEFTFKAGVKMSHEERISLLLNKDKFIGQTAEIRFFEYTDDGLPRFPVMVGIRLDK